MIPYGLTSSLVPKVPPEFSTASEESIVIHHFEPGTTYVVQVRRDCDIALWSPPLRITTPPPPPVIKTVEWSSRPRLNVTWEPCLDAQSYRLNLHTADGSEVLQAEDIDGTSWSGEVYMSVETVRIYAIDAEGSLAVLPGKATVPSNPFIPPVAPPPSPPPPSPPRAVSVAEPTFYARAPSPETDSSDDDMTFEPPNLPDLPPPPPLPPSQQQSEPRVNINKDANGGEASQVLVQTPLDDMQDHDEKDEDYILLDEEDDIASIWQSAADDEVRPRS